MTWGLYRISHYIQYDMGITWGLQPSDSPQNGLTKSGRPPLQVPAGMMPDRDGAFPKLRVPMGGPNHKDHSCLGSILGSWLLQTHN